MRISVIFILISFFLCNGCKPEVSPEKEIIQDDFIGSWEIFHATRNGKVTKSLESGNFVFQADNLVSSNLFANSNSLNFTYDKGNIRIEGEPNMTSLKIEKLQNDTLIVSSRMKVFNMKFFLIKK